MAYRTPTLCLVGMVVILFSFAEHPRQGVSLESGVSGEKTGVHNSRTPVIPSTTNEEGYISLIATTTSHHDHTP